MQTLVATVLVDDNENDVLRFSFPDNVKLDVSLTGENGNHQLKEFFEKLLTFHLKDDVEVVLSLPMVIETLCTNKFAELTSILLPMSFLQ